MMPTALEERWMNRNPYLEPHLWLANEFSFLGYSTDKIGSFIYTLI